jgi:hypothetical protein
MREIKSAVECQKYVHLEELLDKISRERLELFVECIDVGIGSGHCCFQRGFATSWGDG